MAKVFKSVWFKCITVLLALTVILGGTLAILNDVLYVSPEERTSRAINKIYGEEIEYTSILDVDAGDTAKVYTGIGQVNKVYAIGEDLLFQAEGYNGYKGGSITLWVKVVKGASENMVIDKIVLAGYEKQTLMSKLDGAFYSNFYVDVTEAYNNGQLFSPVDNGQDLTNPITGATKSANAACNAVNAVIKYVGEAK